MSAAVPGYWETSFNAEILRFAVMRQIFCPRTGKVLDVRTAVLVTIENADRAQIATEVMTGEAWDEVQPAVMAACKDKGLTADVIDGRELASS